jgi:hypothetical protein
MKLQVLPQLQAAVTRTAGRRTPAQMVKIVTVLKLGAAVIAAWKALA